MTSTPTARGVGDLGDAGGPRVDGHDQADPALHGARRPPPATGRGPRRDGSARTGPRRGRTGAGRGRGWPDPSRPSASKSPKTMTRSPPVAGARQSVDGRSSIRQQAWVMEARRAARRTRPRHPGRRPRRAGRAGRPSAAADAVARGRGDDVIGDGDGIRGRPSGSGVPARGSGCHGALACACTGRRRGAARSWRPGGGVTRPRRRSSQRCQSTSSGLATNTDEYVPMMMPMSSARTKSRIASPPNRNSASSVMRTVRLVVIDRPTVCRMSG